MNVSLCQTDLDAIASAVVVQLRPIISRETSEKKEVLDVSEVADYLGVEPSWIYKQVQFKAIPHCHVGKYLRFRTIDIDSWLANRVCPDISNPAPSLSRAAELKRNRR